MPSLLEHEADSWLDEDEFPVGRRRSFKGVLSPLKLGFQRFIRFAQTTPGKLSIITTVLVVAIMAAGLALTLTADNRQTSLNKLVTQTEPLSNNAQELFNSLSVADSAVTTGFLQKNSADNATQETFNKAISDASNALIRATSGIDTIESREMELVLSIQQSLPEYVQLVADAQTNDRLLNPIGASYLTQASALMQNDMLPNAQELYTRTSSTLFEEQDRQVSPMWFPLTGLFAAVGLLLLAQFWLAAKTNRRLNIGWLFATILMIIATLWATVTTAVVWYQGTQAVQSSVKPLEQLTEVRISVQQARTREALGLIQRDYDESAQQEFSNNIRDIDETLADLRNDVDKPGQIDAAREALRQWDSSHASMASQIRQGNYNEAIEKAMGGKNTDQSTSFGSLDRDLQELISDTRNDLQTVLIDGRVAAGRTSAIVIIMTIFAAIAVLVGVRPRLQEFL